MCEHNTGAVPFTITATRTIKSRAKMSSSSMISVPSQANTYREMFFRLEKPVQLTQQEFDEFWPLVDTV